MNHRIAPLLLLPLLIPFAWAQIRVPKGMLELEKWESVRTQAQSKRELLVFIKVNPNVEAGYIQEAFQSYFRSFRGYGPVILVPLDAKAAQLPSGAALAFNSLSGGYPQVAVVDPDTLGQVAAVPYTKIAERDRELRKHRTEISRYIREKRKQPRVAPTPPAAPSEPAPLW